MCFGCFCCVCDLETDTANFLCALSVVFAGFSAEALKSRILDGKSALTNGEQQ